MASSAQEKLLRVVAPHFVAGSIWRKNTKGEWRCIEAAPIIKWMVGKGPEIGDYLKSKGWTVSWH